MKVGVYIRDDSCRYVYGMTIIEKDYMSCYDAREAAIKLINKIFDNPEILDTPLLTNLITVVLGGAAPYKATFNYMTISEDGII